MTDLTKIDGYSPTWLTVRDWAQDRLDSFRRQLEAPGQAAAEYDVLRGRLGELRTLLNLTLPQPEPSPDDHTIINTPKG